MTLVPASSAGSGGSVPSVFGRTGTIIAAQDDYPAKLIDAHGVRPVFNVASYGAKGDGSTDDTTAIQNAINDAHTALGGIVYIPANFSCKFTSQLTIYSGVSLLGDGVQGQLGTSQLSWYGPDATHAIVASGTAQSRLRIRGIRLDDKRTSPTAGDGLHLTTTNGCALEHVGAFGFPGNAIYLGNTTATPDNYTLRHIWVSAKVAGVCLDHTSENTVLIDIKGDCSTSFPMDLILLKGSAGAGMANPVIVGAKMEANNSSLGTAVVHADSTFVGTLTCFGIHAGANATYGIRSDSANIALTWAGVGTNGPIGTALVYDSVSGKSYGTDTSDRMLGLGTIAHGGGATTNTLSAAKLTIPDLPTADPHVAGQLWSNSGIVTVSAG